MNVFNFLFLFKEIKKKIEKLKATKLETNKLKYI